LMAHTNKHQGASASLFGADVRQREVTLQNGDTGIG
jgi:hypothetical protein